MRSEADNVDAYLTELPDDRRRELSVVGVEGFIAAYERSRRTR